MFIIQIKYIKHKHTYIRNRFITKNTSLRYIKIDVGTKAITHERITDRRVATGCRVCVRYFRVFKFAMFVYLVMHTSIGEIVLSVVTSSLNLICV